MTTLGTSPRHFGGESEGAFRYVVRKVGDTIEALEWLCRGLEGRSPEAARHIRELAERLAGETIASLRAWPS